MTKNFKNIVNSFQKTVVSNFLLDLYSADNAKVNFYQGAREVGTFRVIGQRHFFKNSQEEAIADFFLNIDLLLQALGGSFNLVKETNTERHYTGHNCGVQIDIEVYYNTGFDVGVLTFTLSGKELENKESVHFPDVKVGSIFSYTVFSKNSPEVYRYYYQVVRVSGDKIYTRNIRSLEEKNNFVGNQVFGSVLYYDHNNNPCTTLNKKSARMI